MTAVKKGAHRASAAVMPGLWGLNHACNLHAHMLLSDRPHDSVHQAPAAARDLSRCPPFMHCQMQAWLQSLKLVKGRMQAWLQSLTTGVSIAEQM